MNYVETSEHLLHRGLKLSHLRLMAALADTEQISTAAENIAVAQPAASRLLAEIERIIGAPVHHRAGRGIVLSEAGRAFAQRAKRILLEIQDTGRVIDEIVSGGSGHVRIGSVTGPAIDRVLPALRNARLTAPKVTSEVIVAPSDILCEHLASGRIDFAIGRMPQGQGRELFNLVDIAAEPVALVVRKGHPLANRADPRLQDLLDYDWIMPPPDSLLTRAVLARLSHFGQPAPFQRLSTASFLLTFALLQQSNAIAPLALPVAHIFSRAPDSLYQILEVDLGIEVASYGLMTRIDVVLPPAAAQLALAIQSHTPSVD